MQIKLFARSVKRNSVQTGILKYILKVMKNKLHQMIHKRKSISVNFVYFIFIAKVKYQHILLKSIVINEQKKKEKLIKIFVQSVKRCLVKNAILTVI